MKSRKVKVSDSFRKMAFKAVLSIVFFVFTYLVLVILAILLTVLCGYAGVLLIAFKPTFITIVIGAGLISIGILILIFLFKFVFKRNTVDRSNLIEITRLHDPKLFQFIEEIVSEVQTNFPRKIFLSPDVNASVFYSSGFWSMFLPIRKNLIIGLGLANSVSVSEFKAILAHEFGHFSQRSMKVGSYVYNVNKVIYNLLYENESYNELVNRWANLHSYLTIFVAFAYKIVTGIQWILKKVYEIVNINYMALSREMEFHADEIAANVAGSNHLISSLLRLSLAEHAYQTVLDYYNEKPQKDVKTENLFEQQLFVMNFIAKKNHLPFTDNLPLVTPDQLSRYNKSKLVISDQWASHPATNERVTKLENLKTETAEPDNNLASSIFTNFPILQNRITEQVFSYVKQTENPVILSNEEFSSEFNIRFVDNSFDETYNGYYDDKNPPHFNTNDIEVGHGNFILQDLFNNEIIDHIYTVFSLENDLNLISQIANGSFELKSFDYDGIKYVPSESKELINRIEAELKSTKEKIQINDLNIFRYFMQNAVKKGKDSEFALRYSNFVKTDCEMDRMSLVCNQMMHATSFIFQTTPYDIILNNLEKVSDLEEGFKKEIEFILSSEIFNPLITNEMKNNFEKYISQKWIYFGIPDYYEDVLNILLSSISDFRILIQRCHFSAKKDFLQYQLNFV